MTAGIVGFGGLLWTRHRLRAPEGPQISVSEPEARSAGRAVLTVGAVIAALVGVIVTARLRAGGSIGLLSVAMPLTGLTWLAMLGRQTYRHRHAPPTTDVASGTDRPSRRPPSWDALGSPSTPSPSSPPNRQVNA